MARLLRPQETFNAAVVEYLNEVSSAVHDLSTQVERLEGRARHVEDGFSTLQELRTSVGVLLQTSQTLKHEVARLAGGAAAAPGTAAPAAPVASLAAGLDGDAYVGFEDAFRGDPDVIRARLSRYVPLFRGATDVLDIGCGRGEFLALLRAEGIGARGIDLNPSMVQVCRAAGGQADATDALTALRAAPPGSLGGLFAAQVVEHLEPRYLTAMLSAAFDALRPGSPIVLETINPACWFAFFESYLRDITHVRALHPDTLKYLLIAAGFQRVEISYQVPYPDGDKLQSVPQHPMLADTINTLNRNVEKLNGLLFTWLDYAAIGYRP